MAGIVTARFTWCLDDAALPVPDETTQADDTWGQYQGRRNLVLDALRPFGTVGPMGSCPPDLDPDDPEGVWPVEDADPTFFVVDDWMGPIVHVDVASSALLSLDVLEELWRIVDTTANVRIGIAVPNHRCFYLDTTGIWFIDADRLAAPSVRHAVALPLVPDPAA